MSEKTTEDEILELITLVDEKYEEKVLDTILHSPYFPMFVALVTIFVPVEIYLLAIQDLGKQLSIAIPFSALLVAFFALMTRSFIDVLIRRNYKRLSKSVTENQKPLLKALIKMKAKNSKTKLEQIYNLNEPMFRKEKLLERLYE